jgi:hypothetical protein
MVSSDWAIVLATLAGPVLAVQAQKWVEGVREYRNRKLWVFSTLMATRAARLSLDHVRALNMIEMAFYGRRVFGVRHQKKSEREVVDAWYDYLDDLGVDPNQIDITRRTNLFIGLLFKMAADVGLRFDRMQITKSVYMPVAHGEAEMQEQELRRRALDVFSGTSPLKMEVTSFPVDPNALAAQIELQQKMSGALEDGALKIKKN